MLLLFACAGSVEVEGVGGFGMVGSSWRVEGLVT